MKEHIADYIEFWATRHCNLNCAGCSSCAPLKSPWFLAPENLSRDLNRLKQLGITIKNAGVLGGEPLLHPNITEIFFAVKSVYPDVNIILLTNGLLLPSMDEDFMRACQNFKVELRVTCFPIMPPSARLEVERLLRHYDLRYHLTDKKFFNKILVLNNKGSFDKIVQNCGCNKAYNLFEGTVARCPIPMVAPDLNDYFKVNFLLDGRLDIYSVESADEIMRFLDEPNMSCMNCSERTKKVAWKKSEGAPHLSDWLLESEEVDNV